MTRTLKKRMLDSPGYVLSPRTFVDILLWMAEGIIQQSRDSKQLEDLGSGYFHDLVSRSIFQHSNSDSSKFVIHDLVHDLAQSVLGETSFMLEEANHKSKRLERVRHFS